MIVLSTDLKAVSTGYNEKTDLAFRDRSETDGQMRQKYLVGNLNPAGLWSRGHLHANRRYQVLPPDGASIDRQTGAKTSPGTRMMKPTVGH